MLRAFARNLRTERRLQHGPRHAITLAIDAWGASFWTPSCPNMRDVDLFIFELRLSGRVDYKCLSAAHALCGDVRS